MEIPVHEAYLSRFEEYTQLTTLERKLNFWNKKLPLNYIQYQETEDSELLTVLAPFRIEPQKEQWEWLHQWTLKHYFQYSTNPKKDKNYLLLEDLTENMLERLEGQDESAQMRILKGELREVGSAFREELAVKKGLFGRLSAATHPPCFHKYNADLKTFQEYLSFRGAEPSYAEVYPALSATLQVANGLTMARYYMFLEKQLSALEGSDLEQLKHSVESLETNKKKRKFTDPQVVLIAHYVGALDGIRQLPIQEKQKAILAADMLCTGAENTEKYMKQIGSLNARTSTERNYEFLVDYFDEKGLFEVKTKCLKVLQTIRNSKQTKKR